MNQSLVTPASLFFEDDIRAPQAIAPRRQLPDPVGMWYTARRRHGQDDRMWLALYRGNSQSPQWHTCSHRVCDGLGAISLMLDEAGHGRHLPPAGRPSTAPDPLELWRNRKAVAGPAPQMAWKTLEPALKKCVSHTPVCVLLSLRQTRLIEQAAASMGVSSTVWLLWTADRALRATLAEPGSVTGWVYPVNMRGSVHNVDRYANHCSGLNLTLTRDADPDACKEQIRARFASHEHWRNWLLLTLGRWVGQRGIDLLYRVSQAAPGRFAGSYSNLGEWNVPGLAGLTAVAPGSAAYPVSVGTAVCNGRRTLSCRLHPVIGGDTAHAIEFLKVWREISLNPLAGLAPEKSAAEALATI